MSDQLSHLEVRKDGSKFKVTHHMVKSHKDGSADSDETYQGSVKEYGSSAEVASHVEQTLGDSPETVEDKDGLSGGSESAGFSLRELTRAHKAAVKKDRNASQQ